MDSNDSVIPSTSKMNIKSECNNDTRKKVLVTNAFKDYLVSLGVGEPVDEKKKPTKSVHEGAKPFKCKLCDYETGLNFNLKKHTEIVHEGLKPFKCKICDFKTGDKTNLKTHIDSVHEGIKPFKCKLCDYKAARNFNLKHHIESVHQGIKAFKCNICGIETAQKSDLKKHIKFVHESKKNESYKKISEASVVISNDVVVKKEKGTKYDDILESDENPNFQSIKVETFPLEQSKTSDTADPLLIHEIKEEVFEENETTPIYIKQEEEFDASGYQIVQENGMIVEEIKEEYAFWE